MARDQRTLDAIAGRSRIDVPERSTTTRLQAGDNRSSIRQESWWPAMARGAAGGREEGGASYGTIRLLLFRVQEDPASVYKQTCNSMFGATQIILDLITKSMYDFK